jgi:hypothetical protein
MAAVPPDTRFRKDDFPGTGLGSNEVLDRLFLPLNTFLKAVRSALSGGLTFSENFRAEVKTVSITTPASGTGVLSCFPFDVKSKVSQPIGVLLLSADDRSTAPAAPSLGGVSWLINADGTLQITNLPGLLLGRKYDLTLLIVGG